MKNKRPKLFMRLQDDEDYASSKCGCILQRSPGPGMDGCPEFLRCASCDAQQKQRDMFVSLFWAAENLLSNMDDLEESKNDDGNDWDDVQELRKQIKRARKCI